MQIQCFLGNRHMYMTFGDGYGEAEARNFPFDIAVNGSTDVYTFNVLQIVRGVMKV
jgi:hypothetical protein